MSPSEPVILVEKFPTALPAVPACVEIKPNVNKLIYVRSY